MNLIKSLGNLICQLTGNWYRPVPVGWPFENGDYRCFSPREGYYGPAFRNREDAQILCNRLNNGDDVENDKTDLKN